MNNQNDTCEICGIQPEDLLILQCRHNLCIDCATQVYAITAKKSYIVCQICLAQTKLDEETIQCFTKLINNGYSSYRSNALPPKPRSSNIIRQQKHNIICCEHNQQGLYYCFDCQTNKICSQCILTAKHGNHKVATIKNAVKAISRKINENIKIRQSMIEKLELKKSNLIHRKSITTSDMQDKQSSLKEIFDDIVRIISQRYTELNKHIQTISRRNIQIIEGNINEINEKIQAMNSSKIFENSIMKQNQNTIFEYFPKINTQNIVYSVEHNQIPQINLTLLNSTTVHITIKQTLDQLVWIDNDNDLERDCSLIQRQQIMKSHLEQDNSRSQLDRSSTFTNIKKLELSRSITNATNIINKLQMRMKFQ